MIRIHRATRRTNGCRACNVFSAKAFSTELAVKKPVEYPKIEDLSPKAVFRRKQEQYFEKIKNIGTVEEKIIALNLPKYFGWPSFVIKEGTIPYDFLPFSQFITRTIISENDTLPQYLAADTIKNLQGRLKAELEKVIMFENSVSYKHQLENIYAEEEKLPYYDAIALEDFRTRHLVKQMNSAVTRALANEYRHLFSAQVDYEPRLEAFWRVGGFYATKQDKDLRKVKKIDESMIDDPIDRFFQYFGSPILQLRSQEPLECLPSIDLARYQSEETNSDEQTPLQIEGDVKNTETSSPPNPESTQLMEQNATKAENLSYFRRDKLYPLREYRYSPDLYLEIPRERYHSGIMPGFWANDRYRFGLISYHSTNHYVSRPAHYGSEEGKEALHSQAILASYAWAYGQACYQGFTTYNDITYPFTTQSILTDGKIFSFYQYKMNTIVLHSDKNEAMNPLYNECYATVPMELYHDVDVDGVKGWNEQAITNLLTIYARNTGVPEGVDLCPYLNKDVKFISQIQENERRQWLHNIYRHLVSHRPRHRLAPEIYDWERIYKIEHQHRVHDARKRFFERFEDPINDRKLSEYSRIYIARRKRVGSKVGQRHEHVYYPEVYPDYHEIV